MKPQPECRQVTIKGDRTGQSVGVNSSRERRLAAYVTELWWGGTGRETAAAELLITTTKRRFDHPLSMIGEDAASHHQ